MKGTNDMSKGAPIKVLLMFTLPMILSVTFQQLYNIADSMIAGRLLGANALAAVSASYPITMIFTGLGTGLGVGCSVVTGRLYGEKAFGRLKSAVSTAFISFTAIALVCSLAGYFGSRGILALLSTPESIMPDSVDYLAIYMLGLAFIFLYNLCSATFQSLGNSKVPLFFLIFSTLFNIALDIIFLKALGLGVMGLSLATVIAQGVACVMSMLVLVYILTGLGRGPAAKTANGVGKTADGVSKTQNGVEKTANEVNAEKGDTVAGTAEEVNEERGDGAAEKVTFAARLGGAFASVFTYFFGKKSYRRFSWAAFREVMTIGIPTAIQTSTVSIGQLFVQNLVNINGATVLAGYGAATKVNAFSVSLLVTVGNALSIFVSQNVGAGRADRIKGGTLAGLAIIGAFAAVIVPLAMIFAGPLVSLFVDDVADASISAADVTAVGRSMLLILVPFYLVAIFKFIFDGVLKGTGCMMGFISSTGADLVLRVGFSYILFYALGNNYVGIWWSWPLGWVVGAAVSALFYFFGSWRPRLLPRKQERTIEKK